MSNARGQNAAPAESAASKLKEKWTKALTDAHQDFQKSNDRESSDFVAGILDALEKSGGLAPAALAANVKRMQKMTRDLVRRGALESASTLHWAQWPLVNEWGPGADGPNISALSGGLTGPSGLVLYLPFDAPDENGVVRDVSGAGNNGHVQGAKWVSEGKFGGAYQFSLTNLDDRVVIPNSDLLNPEHITLAAWIKTSYLDGFWNRTATRIRALAAQDARKSAEHAHGHEHCQIFFHFLKLSKSPEISWIFFSFSAKDFPVKAVFTQAFKWSLRILDSTLRSAPIAAPTA